MLTRWRDNQIELQPSLEKSLLLKEVGPISQSLSALGAAGLAALHYLDHSEKAPAAWVTEQLALVEQAKKPQAQLLILVAPSIQKLIEASSGRTASPSLPTK